MKVITALLLLLSNACFGQPDQIVEISKTISQETLKKNLYYLASDEMNGRVMASRGDTLASVFVAKYFKDNNVKAPFEKGKSFYQTVYTDQKIAARSELMIGNRSYKKYEGWSYPLRTTDALKLDNIPVVFAGYGIEHSLYNDFQNIDVKGKAVLLLRGQPKNAEGNYLLTKSSTPEKLPSAVEFLKQKGASLVLYYNERFDVEAFNMKKNEFLTVYRNRYASTIANFPVIQLSEQLANELLSATNNNIKGLQEKIMQNGLPQSLELKPNFSIDLDISWKEETAPNVIGIIPGTDTAAGAVIISAHHDHVGNNNGEIYYGAVDNASGTVALMEIAALMNKAAKKGLKPKRTIILASFTGEEKGLIGSHYLANNPVYPLAKTWGILNIDMMGRVDTFYSGRRADSSYAYILVVDSVNHDLRKSLFDANEKAGKLKLDTYYEQAPASRQRRLTGSDQYPFYQKGIPIIRIDCGFSKDYHQPTDTPDKINYQLLADQVQLAFLTTWNIANSPSAESKSKAKINKAGTQVIY